MKVDKTKASSVITFGEAVMEKRGRETVPMEVRLKDRPPMTNSHETQQKYGKKEKNKEGRKKERSVGEKRGGGASWWLSVIKFDEVAAGENERE